MKKPPINQIFKKPKQGIVTDANYNEVPQGATIGALDITDIEHGSLNEDGFTQLNNNTELAFNLGDKVIQLGKVYNLKFDIPDEAFDITIKIIHRSNTWSVTIPTSCATLTSNAVFNDIATNLNDNYNYLYPDFFWSYENLEEGSDFLSFDMIFVNFAYDDYFVEVTMVDTATGKKKLPYKLLVVNDAISVDKEGYLKPISMVSLGSKLFIFSTIQSKEVLEAIDFNGMFTSPIVDDGYSEMLLDWNNTQNIPFGTEVKIFNNVVTNAQALNGTFTTAESRDFAGQFIIPNLNVPPASNVSPIVTGNKMQFYTRTVSCIGVAEKNETTGKWTYVELLRSTNLNFRTYHKIDAKVISTDLGYLFSWVDGFNKKPRRLTYEGEFVENGFLELYNPLNKYDLDNINEESQLIVSNNLARIKLGNSYDLEFSAQAISGAKPTATYQAFVRFATDDGQYGVFSPPSNTSTIFLKKPSGFWEEQVAGVTTDAALIIDITNIKKGLYSFFQVAIVEMTGNTFNVYALPQQALNDEDERRVIDTGRRASDYLLIDDTLINEIQFSITAAESIENYDNRIEFAKVKLQNRYNLTDWAKQIVVTYAKEAIEPASNVVDEYINQYYVWYDFKYCKWLSDRYLSYAPFETVRWGIMVWFKDGGTPITFYIGDIRVDATTLTPNDYTGLAMANTSEEVLQIVAKFTNINLDYQLDSGEILSDIIEDWRFVRADITSEMLWSGVAITGDALLPPSPTVYLNNQYTGSAIAPINIQNDKFFTYVPDFINNGYKFVKEDGDKVYFIEPNLRGNGASFEYADYYGNNGNSGMGFSNGKLVDSFSDNIPTVKLVTPTLYLARYGRYMKLTAPIPTPSGTRNCYQFYYVREINGDKYGSIYSTPMFIVLSDYYNPSTHNKDTVYTAYSGNMFIQKSYYTIEQTTNAVGTDLYLAQKVLGFYSMNRYNSQLRNGIFLKYLRFYYPIPSTKSIIDDTYTYDTTFNPRYIYQNQKVFNPNLIYLLEEKASIYWSEKAIDNGTFGQNRIFRPLNKKALEGRYGGITHIETFNIETQTYLATWQPYQFTLQYFNNTGQLITENSQVLLGTGDIMGRKGADVTRFGSSHKWSIVKGVNPQGKPVMYWYSANERHLMRMGADGLSTISLSAGFEAFLNKYCLLNDPSNIVDEPANFYGVHGVWNDLKKQYILTFRGIRQHTEWLGDTGYSREEWVSFNDETFGFEQIPVLYKCKKNNTGELLTNTEFWEKFDYYNSESIGFFTIVWDEYSNSLKTLVSHIPMCYGDYKSTFLSGSPTNINGEGSGSFIYEHNKENQARYYCSRSTEYSGTDISLLGLNQEYDGVIYKSYLFESSVACNTRFNISTLPNDMSDFLEEHISKYILSDNNVLYRVKYFIDSTHFLVDEFEDVVWEETTLKVVTCNTGQPYFEMVVNETAQYYSMYGQISMYADYPVERIEFEAGLDSLGQKTTKTFLDRPSLKYFNGMTNAQIPNDNTNNPSNNRIGKNYIQGYWMKVKSFFTLNIKNKIDKFAVKAKPLQP